MQLKPQCACPPVNAFVTNVKNLLLLGTLTRLLDLDYAILGPDVCYGVISGIRRMLRASARPRVRQPDFFTTLPKARFPVVFTMNSQLSSARIHDYKTTFSRVSTTGAIYYRKRISSFFRRPGLDLTPSNPSVRASTPALPGFLASSGKFRLFIPTIATN